MFTFSDLLQFSNQQFRSRLLLVSGIVLVCVGGIVTIVGCQMRSSEPDTQTLASEPAAAASEQNVKKKEFVPFYPAAATANHLLISLDRDTCENFHPESSTAHISDWQLSIVTPFGDYFAQVRVDEMGATPNLTLAIDGHQLQIPLRASLFDQVKQACAASTKYKDKALVIASDAFQEEIIYWVKQASPDCDEIKSTEKGWQCRLPSIDPTLAKQELVGIRSTMIRRWTRRPYLLTHRVALVSRLAETLTSPRFDEEMSVLCRLVHHSLPIELPATLSSERWQAAACNLDSPFRREAANIGLAKAMGEIDFLRQLFERTSRIGYLTVSVPHADAPTKNLWVSLHPDTDNDDFLVEETRKLWSESSDASREGGIAPRACWHPLFGEDTNLLALARYLDIAGDSPDVTCKKAEPIVAANSKTISPEKYLAVSVASETEFVVTNGRTKMLRLPKGRYIYKLQGLPEDPTLWDDASAAGPQTSGSIEWLSQRPRPQIKQW